jgi:predicted dehydrogenase
MVKRAPLNAEGEPYEQADDSAMVMLRFRNGAQGLVHASAIAYEKRTRMSTASIKSMNGIFTARTARCAR